MVAFLGMGLLGSNFVKALLNKGYGVNVWNRSPARAQALQPLGAHVFATAADAVAGADRVHLTLKDDAAVNEVLAQAEPGLKKGCIIIDHTTTSAEGAVERTAAWAAKGFTYVHAPVFMGPQNALESTGTMMVSGDPAILADIVPELEKMTGKVLNFGTKAGTAAGIKLIGNLFLIAMTAGVSDALSLATGLGIGADDVATLFASWNPAGMLPARLQKITSGSFDKPTWELNMARKDARLMMEAAAAHHKTLTVIPPVAAHMDALIAEGFGQYDWTVIAKDALA